MVICIFFTTVLRMVLADLSELFSTGDAPCTSLIVFCPVSAQKLEKVTALPTIFFCKTWYKLRSFLQYLLRYSLSMAYSPTCPNPDEVSAPANFQTRQTQSAGFQFASFCQKTPVFTHTLVYKTTHNHRFAHGMICLDPCCLKRVKLCFCCDSCRSVKLSTGIVQRLQANYRL